MTAFYLKSWLGELIVEVLRWNLWLLMLRGTISSLWFILHVKLEVILGNAGIMDLCWELAQVKRCSTSPTRTELSMCTVPAGVELM